MIVDNRKYFVNSANNFYEHYDKITNGIYSEECIFVNNK